jgi:hypothetical protein
MITDIAIRFSRYSRTCRLVQSRFTLQRRARDLFRHSAFDEFFQNIRVSVQAPILEHEDDVKHFRTD